MIVSEQLNYTKTWWFYAIFLPVIIEFPRCVGTYSSAKFELITKWYWALSSYKDFKDSQTEYSQYRTAIEKWKKETGKEPVAHGIRAKLAEKKQEIQNEQKNKQHTRSQNKDRGAR